MAMKSADATYYVRIAPPDVESNEISFWTRVKGTLISVSTLLCRFFKRLCKSTDCQQVSGPRSIAQLEYGTFERQNAEYYSAGSHGDSTLFQGFTPVEELTVDHLPDNFKDEDLVQCLRALSELSVAVHLEINKNTVNCLGTGRVSDVFDMTDRGKCCCRRCKALDLSARSDKWWVIVVQTAPNLVEHARYAMRSARSARGCGPRSARGRGPRSILTVKGKGGWFILHVSKDLPKLQCVTCNLNIVSRLFYARETFNNLFKICCDKFLDKTICDKCHIKKRVSISICHRHEFQLREKTTGILHSADCDCCFGGFTICL